MAFEISDHEDRFSKGNEIVGFIFRFIWDQFQSKFIDIIVVC